MPVAEILCHQSGGEYPAAGLHALRESNAAVSQFDRKQRLHRAWYYLLGHGDPPTSELVVLRGIADFGIAVRP
jgi:hypothetical protein